MSAATGIPEPKVDQDAKVRAAAPVRPESAFVPVPLFSTVLLDVADKDRRRRGFSTMFSFVVQCLILGVLLIVPLMFTDALPRQQLLTFLVAPPPPPPPPPPAAAENIAKVVKQIQTDIMDGRLKMPTKIPTKVEMIKEEEAPPPISSGVGVVGGVPGGIPGGQMGGVIGGIISSTANTAVVPKLAVVIPKRIRISQGVTKGQLVRRVDPPYPSLARQARIQGEVVLTAIISKDGSIQNLQVMSGHPMLVPAALEAVKMWRYKPFLLSGEPVEVETTITVTFQLSQ